MNAPNVILRALWVAWAACFTLNPLPVEAQSGGQTENAASSIVKVRVVSQHLPPREFAGALVHAGEFPEPMISQGNWRYVIANLPGISPQKVLSGAMQLMVVRNGTGEDAAPQASGYPARFVRMDTAGVWLIRYEDERSYTEDAGLKIARKPAANRGGRWLRLVSSFDALTAESLGTRTRDKASEYGRAKKDDILLWKPFRVDSGLLPESDEQGSIELPELKSDERPGGGLLLSQDGALTGFFTPNGNSKAAVVSAKEVNLTLKLPEASILRIVVPQGDAAIATVRVAAGDFPLQNLALVSSDDPGAANVTAKANGWYTPIPTGQNYLFYNQVKDDVYEVRLPLRRSQQSSESLVRVFQGRVRFDGLDTLHTRPAATQWTKKDGVLMPSPYEADAPLAKASAPPSAMARENEKAADKPASAVLPEKKLQVETPVRQMIAVNEGREVLLRLDGAPYWKRLSMSTHEWLPLPEMEASQCTLTGNLDAIFVLNRVTGELRRHRLNDMQMEASVTLPGSTHPLAPRIPHKPEPNAYFSIVAGNCTASGPLHVLHSNGSFSLKPKTLAPMEYEKARNAGPMSDPDRAFNAGEDYEATGDGHTVVSPLSLARTYHTDLGGLRTSYWGESGGDRENLGGSVSGGFTSEIESAYDAVFGKSRAVAGSSALPRQMSHVYTSVAPNSPIVFRILWPHSRSNPAGQPMVELRPLRDSEPFASFEAPEFTPMSAAQANTRKSRRHLMFDPYSMNILTLAPDERTIVLRNIARVLKPAKPVLLNWPDTCVERGGTFRFKPLVIGGKNVSAEISGHAGLVRKDTDGESLQAQVPHDAFASLMLMNVQVSGPGPPASTSYTVPLHVLGMAPPFVVNPEFNSENLDAEGLALTHLNPPPQVAVLPSFVHRSIQPISLVVGPVRGHLALVTTDGVDVLSLAEKKIVGRIPSSEGCYYFAGAGALFKWDSVRKNLS
ncbi:MAG: hypothetical protein ACAH88_14420 [Roseimicrobium sp.]